MAARGSKLDIQEAFLTCSICMEPYKGPKILPCVHTFCCHCLKSYLISGAANRKKGGFPCPTCRQHVPIAKPSKPPETWPDQLKDNFVMSSMLEALSQQKSTPVSPPASPTSATNCSPQPADKDSACTKGTDYKTDCTCPGAREMVCWDCSVFVCGSCSVIKHAACTQVQKVCVAGPENRQKMLEWLPQLSEQLIHAERRHDVVQSRLSSTQARLGTVQAHITQAAQDAIQMVRLQEHRLKEMTEKHFEVIIQHHQQRHSTSSADVDNMKSLKEAMEQCVVENDVELLRQTQCLKQRYTAVEAYMADNAHMGDGEDDARVLDAGSFVPASLADLKSMVLVGVFHPVSDEALSSLPQSPVTSAPSSPSSDGILTSSYFHLPEGPVIRHRPHRQSEPSVGLLTSPEYVPDESQTPCSFTNPLLLSGRRFVTCQHTCSFSAKGKGDRTQPVIRDLVVLTNGWLVATDTANRCVKCFFKTHPQDVRYQCKRLSLSQNPYGVSIMEGCLVVVTVPKERQLQMVMARPHLVPLTTLTLPSDLQHTVWAVTSLGDQRLAVTTCPHGEMGSVLILQVTGEGVQCVVKYTSIVRTPLYIAVTSNDNLVITDPTSCHVACITSTTGHVVFHFYTNGKVMGVATRSKALLVADQSPALSLLTNEGNCVHTMPLPRGKTGCSQPRAVAVATDDTVYVSDDTGKIHLFHLTWLADHRAET